MENTLLFVGKKHKQALTKILEFLDDKESPVFLLEGEPGMGKSRVLDEFMNAPLFEGDEKFVKKFIVYRDDSIETILTSWLDDLLSKISMFKGNKERWKKIIESIPAFGKTAANLIKDTTKPAKQKFIEALEYISDKLKESDRLVIVIDPYSDLKTHENAEVLEHFVAECPPKVKFVIAQRNTDKLLESSKFIGQVKKNRYAVKKISEQEVIEAIDAHPILKQMDDEDRERFIRKAGGWALALDAYSKEIIADPKNIKAIIEGLPADLETRIKADYKALDSKARAVVETLSLLGAAFDYTTLAALAKANTGELGEIIDCDQTCKLIETTKDEKGKEKYAIRHALYSQWIVDQLNSRIDIQDRYKEFAAFFKARFDEDETRGQDLIHYVNYLYQGEDEDSFLDETDGLGPIMYRLTLYDAALDFERKRLYISRNSNNQTVEGEALNNIGELYRAWGKNERALEYLKKSLNISKGGNNPHGEGATLNNISLIYTAWGKNDKALEYLKQSFSICLKNDNREGVAATLNNISQVYRAQGKVDEAFTFLKQSQKICKKNGIQIGEGVILNNIGEIYKILGKYDKALKHYLQSLDIRRKIKDKAGEGKTLNNIGLIYFTWKNNDKALDYFKHSLMISTKVGDRSGESVTRFNISIVFEKQGKIKEAIEMMEMTVALDKDLKHPALESDMAYLEKLRAKL